ncbi:Mov34/MPN/PAD-1 family protein [Glutamicibacter sp. TV12E]|uniref:Mov34/MPN/PAD-1 family protein n=1 Tax=Glutamicibacter sp. TV12E TaxID=3446362 RepID=UPI004033E567
MRQIKISDSARASINREAKRSYDGLETGGILLGTETRSGNIIIRHAGDPGPGAQRGQNTFIRDLEHAQKLAQTAWNTDKSEWIGEWHTHPSGPLSPSNVDLHSYLRHLHDRELAFARFVAIIACVDSSGRTTTATWLIDSKQIQRIKMEKMNDTEL